MTRAIGLIILVGNANILKLDPSWEAWIAYAHSKNACVGMTPELREHFSGVLATPEGYLRKARTKLREALALSEGNVDADGQPVAEDLGDEAPTAESVAIQGGFRDLE